MSYSEKLTYYRTEFKKHLDARDAANAKLYAILYAKVLREICGQISSYADRAKLESEANKYDIFAAMITRYGITDDVIKVISGRKTASASKKTAKNPSAASLPEAPQVTLFSNGSPAPTVTPAPSAVGEDVDWCAEIFEKNLPATLVVKTGSGIGTGFFVTADGYFITNHHVIHEGSKRASHITIESGDGKIRCEAEFIKADKALDVSLLKIKNYQGKTPFIPLIKDYSQVRPGIAMLVIGNGLNFGLAPTAGNVKYSHSKSDDDLVYTAPTNNGDSGAPVFNKEGECIGIHKSSTVGQTIGNTQIKVTGLANATHAQNIRELLGEWGLAGKV